MKKKIMLFVLLICLLMQTIPAFAADGESRDISKNAVFSRDGKNKVTHRANDRDMCTFIELEPGEHLSVRASDKKPLGWLFLRYWGLPAPFTVTELAADGTALREQTVTGELLSGLVELGENCCTAVICCETDKLKMAEVSVYTAGKLPADVPVYTGSVEKTDMLIITTHPDDEWLFLGAVYPIFCAEAGHTGTVAYLTTPSYGRLHEALNGMYAGGLRTYPFFLGMKDIDRSMADKQKDDFTEEMVALALVRLYRQIRPLVVVTQDPVNGEYGHFQHVIGAQAALKAATLAGDPEYDPESAATLGVWSPLKVYQHMVTENSIMLDCSSPLAAFNGDNALTVAKACYKHHKSQLRYSFSPTVKAGNYGDLRIYGLAYSSVGPDTGNDMFENIPAELLIPQND